ncbi:hypothetical protein STEG23_005007 [Scotinomys teguina]
MHDDPLDLTSVRNDLLASALFLMPRDKIPLDNCQPIRVLDPGNLLTPTSGPMKTPPYLSSGLSALTAVLDKHR